MRRLVISLAGGVLIPSSYAAIVGPLTVGVEDPTVRHILSLPIRWPVFLFYRAISDPRYVGNVYGLGIYIIVCDVLLYAFLTYIGLSLFLNRKSKQTEAPPEPPQFIS